jgi:hypothetical protein
MATFDQLAEDQRAIIEIVLRQGRSYEQIGEMLDLPPSRVRELAREALAELAPFTAEFVDPQWRGQLADYVLGQQTGPEAQATRGHLKRSEPARIWAYSLLDALDEFYEDGEQPEIPVGETGGRSRSRGAAAAAAANGDTGTEPQAAKRTGGGLSPAAQSALMRRRVLAGIGIVAVIALLVFAVTQIVGGDDNSKKSDTTASSTGTTPNQAGAQGQIVAQAVLAPIGKSFKGAGVAGVYQSGNQTYALVRAKVPPSTGSNKYVLWLYNSNTKRQALAADKTDKQGNFQGAVPLPNGWQNYKFLDVTYQPTTANAAAGQSVLRGPLTAPQQPSNGSGTNTGTGTTTTP